MNLTFRRPAKWGDGWAYTYGAHTIWWVQADHQPSPDQRLRASFSSSCRARYTLKSTKRAAAAGSRTSLRRRAPTITASTSPTHDVRVEIASPRGAGGRHALHLPESDDRVSSSTPSTAGCGWRFPTTVIRLHHPQQRRRARQLLATGFVGAQFHGAVSDSFLPHLRRHAKVQARLSRATMLLAAVYLRHRRGEQVTAASYLVHIRTSRFLESRNGVSQTTAWRL